MESVVLYSIISLIAGVTATFLFISGRINHLKMMNSNAINDKNRYEEENKRIKTELEQYRLQAEDLSNRITGIDVENNHLLQQIKELKEEKKQIEKGLTSEFENIAHRILNKNAEQISLDQNKRLSDVLNPFKEKIESFERKVNETYEKELRDKLNLEAEVKRLYELNQKISIEAVNLTKALKGDVKKMGNWGELILERVLEQSGLRQGNEYEREVVDKNSDGKIIRPDVIVHLPEEKHIIIDSKVSLNAYERYVNADDEESKSSALKEHLLSVRKHINELHDKKYASSASFNTPDFVLMFIPVEASFAAAVEADHDLFSSAWEKKIVPVSPSTLLATLRTIASIWKQENQNKNALEIAQRSGDLYDKLVGFISDLEKIGKAIDLANGHFDNAMNKLSTGKGNLISRAEKIRELGAKNTKQIPSQLKND
nr:DNA recombination protein RmuC [uncultured Carboxylicivirga sp.]